MTRAQVTVAPTGKLTEAGATGAELTGAGATGAELTGAVATEEAEAAVTAEETHCEITDPFDAQLTFA